MSDFSGNKEAIYSLLDKIKQLADRGVDGEKQAAERKLKSLLKKYKIDYEDFINSKHIVEDKIFKVSDWDKSKDLMMQCIHDTVSNAKILGAKNLKKLSCNVTNEQYIEIIDKYNHYWKNYKTEEDAMFLAFVLRNNIGVNRMKEKDVSNLTDAQRETLSKVKNHIHSINENKYYKKHKLIG